MYGMVAGKTSLLMAIMWFEGFQSNTRSPSQQEVPWGKLWGSWGCIIKHHKLGGLKQEELFFLGSGDHTSKFRIASSWRLKGRVLHIPRSWWWLAILSSPWPIDVPPIPPSLPLSSCGCFPSVCIYFCISSPLCIRTPIRDFPGGPRVKNPPANAGGTASTPGPGRSHLLQGN